MVEVPPAFAEAKVEELERSEQLELATWGQQRWISAVEEVPHTLSEAEQEAGNFAEVEQEAGKSAEVEPEVELAGHKLSVAVQLVVVHIVAAQSAAVHIVLVAARTVPVAGHIAAVEVRVLVSRFSMVEVEEQGPSTHVEAAEAAHLQFAEEEG